jgi:septal ring factor EnvC (AmiA/AmiB activator)
LKVECDDWYGRNLDAKQREDSLKCINADKRLALVEEELQEQSKELAEQSKELAGQSKELAEQSKELAETNKKLIELKQEQSNPVPKNIRGKY